MRNPGLLLSIFLPFFCFSWAHSALVINEFLPDPQGTDGGKEFVELLNTGPESVNLNGVGLQFANGAEEEHWVSRWNCAEDYILLAGQRFLIADRNWQGDYPADVEIYLGLQNGPDAIRLVQGDSVFDLVGYGPLTDPDLMEVSAVPVVTGSSLARRPDGHDTDNNSSDFVPADPSPGQTNFLPFDLRVTAMVMEPPSAQRPDESVTYSIFLENYGTEIVPTCQVVLKVGTEEIMSVLDGNAPGQERSLLFRGIPGNRGRLPIELLVPVPGPLESLNIALGNYQVGAGSLVINEVLSAPDQGQGEWVEFLVTGDNGQNLENYSIRDEGGNWLPLPECSRETGSLIVVAQDSTALAGWMEMMRGQGGISNCEESSAGSITLISAHSWPSLNNSAPDGRDFADRLYLRDAGGCVVDHVTLGWEIAGLDMDVPDGHSLERMGLQGGTVEGSCWAPALAQSGSTPGCENSVKQAGAVGAGLSLNPAILDPDMGVVAINISFEVKEPAVGWDLRLFDLWGELVRDLGGESHGPGPRQLLWDGRDDGGRWLPSGAYVALLRTRSSDGGIMTREKKLAVIKRLES